jgi:SWI/SNF related-matrix-associated actin-dependent regulator of chromatin subfamily C
VKSDLNLEIRRNIFDDKGKEITPADEKDKQANGDGVTTNGTSSAAAAATKAMDDAAKEPKKIFNCYSCGIDCTRLRFHYAKHDPSTASSATPEVKYDLCPNCYFQARMPSSHRSSDFVKLEEPAYSTIPDRDAPWTDSETLLLLEGLEQFDENWTAVANHVGSRTREECVMKFLQLEIQDKYLEDEPDHGSATMRALNGRDPISQSENPVMSVVAFLAQMADPTVVAAAAGRSVEAMNKELIKELEKGMGSSGQEKGKAKENVKSEDSMDVDGQTEVAPASNDTPNPTASLATIGLASAAARAGALASHEEREMTRLVGAAVNLTLQKFELKLAQFAEMEDIVQAERRDLEKGRQQLFLERLAFKKRVKEFEDAIRSASLKEPQEAMRMMQEAVGTGTGKKFSFQAASGTATSAVGPLSAEGGDFKSIEI